VRLNWHFNYRTSFPNLSQAKKLVSSRIFDLRVPACTELYLEHKPKQKTVGSDCPFAGMLH
jgi:hypothetical protein